ncbi:MAG: type II toxin-antitoxin system VapC family toxin [Acidobacteriota bacterium]
MILLDTSGLLAALFPDQEQHEACARALQGAEGPLLLSPFVLAEVDYLVSKLAGVSVELQLLDEVAREAYQLTPFDSHDVEEARSLIEEFRDIEPGLADASIVILSRRHDVEELLTLDQRHFRVLPGPGGRPFRLLPADL